MTQTLQNRVDAVVASNKAKGLKSDIQKIKNAIVISMAGVIHS